MNKTCRDIVALNLLEGLGPKRIMTLLKNTQNTEEIFSLAPARLAELTGLRYGGIEQMSDVRKSRVYAEEMTYMDSEDIHPICCFDRAYPESLKNIYDPPPVLFCKGSLRPVDAEAVAIVGPRRCSLYGLKMAERLAFDLAKKGVTVISGMAKGIDQAAHKGAIKAGGRTIAVMGSGFRHIYPKGSEKLVSTIAYNGAVITEYSSDTMPSKSSFPRRNRIISGMARGVVVVEAAERSGALITADFALDQGREVFAFPGRADSLTSRGTNRLIQNGAKLVLHVGDILEEFEISAPQNIDVKTKEESLVMYGLGEEERGVLGMLEEQVPLHIDQLSASSSTDPRKLSEILMKLEIKGLVKAQAGKNFVRKDLRSNKGVFNAD